MSLSKRKTRHSFGATAPPFIDYLKDILRRYPDGGQILKELIQNADDAGASEVVFLHDERCYGRQSLKTEGLGKYQGPALYAFNNAEFAAEDWQGIQTTGRSVKRNDPNKVGRFGIGFNSVYHITDVPSIFSSKYLGFLDPQEKLFGERIGGFRWSLEEEEDKETLLNLQDQFQPFRDVVKLVSGQMWKDIIQEEKHFKGTLFRFPLRSEASEISDNLYDSNKVVQLFDSFLADADISTLFLRNVSSVSLQHINTKGFVNIRLTVTSSPTVDLSLKTRNESIIDGSTCFKTITSTSEGKKQTKTKWLVTTCCMKEGNVPELDLLAKKLSFRPQVDLAFQCSQASVLTDGRLSVFLPLPNNDSNKTGYPVHVNACFGLTDNRRHIKWQEEDQKYDEAAKWNELLVKEVLPHTYLLMLQDATNLAKSSTLPVSYVYNIWPDLSQTKHKDKWHGIAEDILQRLLKQNTAIFSLAEDERQFVSPAVAVCPSDDTMPPEMMTAVTRALIAGGEKLVTFPDRVFRAVQLAFPDPDTLKWVTPALVRGVLRRGVVSNLSNNDKLSLLQYILTDENYHDLRGLKMLPLSDGTFKTFTNEEKDITLIDNDTFPRVLLPGCKDLFLPDDLSTTSIQHLKQLAATNIFKVFNVDVEIVATFAKKTLPKDWKQTGHVTWEVGSAQHPPLKWLREFWKCLNTHCVDLRRFEGMPLIPIEPLHDTSHSVILARLQQNPTMIFQKSTQSILPDKIKEVIQKVGGTVVNRDKCLKHQDLDSYVLPPSPQNTLQVFMNLAACQVISGIRSAPYHEKEELKAYFSTLDSLTVHERDLLSKMPLFQSMAGEYVATQYKQAVVLGSTPALPSELPMPDSIVRCATEADRRLLLLLKIDLLNTAQVAVHLIDGVEKKYFKKQEREGIMTWILQHGSILFSQNGTLYKKCQDLSFIEIDGELKKTSSIFDPNNEAFKVLFEREFFPPAVFTNTPEKLDSLIRLGLQTKETDVSADNVLHVGTHIDKSHVHSQKAFKKAEALQRLLNGNDLLSQFSHQQLQHLSQLQWVPCENPYITKENNRGKGFYKLEEIRHSEYDGIVGHVMPLTGDFSQKVSSKLGLLRLPPAEKVVENLSALAAVAKAMTDPDKDVQFKTKLHSIYKYMQDHICEVREVMNKRVIPWLWVHNHFVFPHDVVLDYPPDLDLSSYIEKVLDEFLPYKKLLTEFGVKTSLPEKEIEDILHDIKQTIEKRPQSFGKSSELKVSIAILNWMWREKKRVRDNIPVPVMAGSQRFTLQPLSKTVFCDISRDGLEDLQNDQDEIHVIHEEIPPATAQWLNIPFLSTRILRPEFIGIEQCGQSEPITLRIKNILKEYDEENDIFKELIQNAEDAGANTCKFMVDFRNHKDPADSLIDQGMVLCQGPCLWAFNNGLFTEDDWKNILKLGSASKENQVEKIGKFGLGFNAVYHVTDIPSILSGNKLLILDPNVTHLQKHIQNKATPGIKLNLSREQLLHRFPGQFRPYERIFNCNLSRDSTQKFYPGTLIKLPFRTQEEAVKSEISRNVYDRDDIVTFQQDLTNNSQTHLLFLKNINTVSLQNLPFDASTPPQDDQIENIFTATRKVVSTINIPEDTPLGILQNDALKCLMKRDVKCQEVIDCHRANIAELTQQHCDGSDVQFWLLYNCFGTKNSLQMFQRDNKQAVLSLPIGGVAVPLNKELKTGKWVPGETNLVGQAFCFLPLSVATGLPVNLNGSFAVTSNRRGLWESGVKYDWNRALLQDAVTTAYVSTLLVLKNMSRKGTLQRYQYYTFWPNGENVNKPFKPLVDTFYLVVSQHFSGKPLKLFSDGENWCSMDKARFLHPTIQEDKAVGELAMKVCQSNSNTSYLVVPLPLWVRQSFIQTGLDEILQQRTFDWEAFYQEVVFNNLNNMDQKSRNALVLHAIDLKDDAIDNLLRSYPCIPTKNSGKLQYIKNLVNTSGKVAHLFEQEEGRFLGGTKNDFHSPKRIQRLSELGMLSDQLPLEDITERAVTIAKIWQKDKGKAYKHLQCILELMRDSLKDEASPHWETLRNTVFIPACPPVITYAGKGGAVKDGIVRLQKPTDIYSDRCRHLVDMTQSVVDSLNLKIHSDDAVLCILGVCESPSLETVLQQLQESSKHSETCDKQTLFNTAHNCYSFLNKWLYDEKELTAIFERAHSFPFILVEDRFVDVKSVAKNEEFDAKPYLHVLPTAFSSFKNLWKCLCIQKQFTAEQFHGVLKKLSQAYGISPLSNNDLEICLTVVQRGLYEAKDEKQDDCLIPDEMCVLQPSNQLYFNDSPWMEVSEDVTLCHAKISRAVALHFGVITTRHHTLLKHSVENFSPFAEEFGQREKLTVRIKNIISAYPSKKDILKELIQNADDAEATEIHFVWDKRQHSTEKTFGQRWNPLQGPALCVYNNQVFSPADLQGIQQLGEGGKHNLPGKTGKYGLGFNSVYHLTDCPSILTGDKWLCISDPNLKYVEASRESPGVKILWEEECKNTFIDVYNTFLPKEFSLKEGTMFRLPIRTGDMAKTSEISDNGVNVEDMAKLSSALCEDPEGLIMFLKNIRKIQFHEINPGTGKLKTTFSIEKSIHEKSIAEWVSFQNHVQQSLLTHGQTPQEAIYSVKISSSGKWPSQWIIAEQFGSFKVNTDMEGQIGRVPQAALAACVSSQPREKGKISSTSSLPKQDDFIGQAFCSLPLPGKTGLPVHVNGNFEVDSSRRGFWKQDGKSLKIDWNESLKLNVIAPLYANLLNYIRCDLKKVKVNSIHLDSVLDSSYLCFFPTISKDTGQDWHEMIHEVYRSVNDRKLDLIPVLHGSTRQVQHRSITEYTVEWSSVSKMEPSDAPHLSKENRSIVSILDDLGMQLVPSSRKMVEIWTSFKSAGIEVRIVSPLTVGNYLRKKPLNDPTHTEMDLPLPIGQTLIRDKERCSILLEYCIKHVVVSEDSSSSDSRLKKDANRKSSSSVTGLPLLLTQDQILRVFDPDSPKLLSTFYRMFHGHHEDFADFITNTKHFQVLQDGNFLKELTIPVAAKYLKPILLHLLQNCETDPHCRLHVPDQIIHSWLTELWEFFSFHIHATASTNGDGNQALIAIKELFSDCPMLPVVCPRLNNKHVLQTMRKMSSVIPFSKEEIILILMKLGLMTLDLTFFQEVNRHLHQYLLPELMRTSDSSAVLDQVHQLDNSEFQHLSDDELKTLQNVLQSGICSSKNKQDYQRKLKSLPLFETIQGGRQRIDGPRNVYILNTEFRERFPDLYMADDNNIFLKYNIVNESLSKYLSIKILSDLEYYVQFILPFLHKLNNNQVIHSVQLLLSLQLKQDYQQYHDKIISIMKNVKFIRDIHGNLQMASYFFDENQMLYKVMLPQERFVPESFWNEFHNRVNTIFKSQARKLLKELGMKCTVSDEEMIEFAHQIELDAKGTASLKGLKLMSSTLFETIFKRNVKKLAPDFLKTIADIKFVFPVEIQKRLCNYHQSYAGKRTVVSIRGCLIENDVLHPYLIWTSMPILHVGNCNEKHIQMIREAGAVDQPPSERVTENLRNICQSPCQTADLVRTRAEVFRTSYTYLQTIEFDPKPLTDLPVVLVEEDSALVKSKQTTLILLHCMEFRPYLYCTPPKDVKFAEFFKKIGVKDEPTAEQYCNVLQEIHADSTDKQTLQPNQEKTVKRAVEQLFHLIIKLQENQVASEIPKTLYLPSTDGRLYPSASLYFNDTVFKVSRLEGVIKDKLKLLEKLSNCHLENDMYEHCKMIQLLPLEIQPKMLSQITVENVVESNMQLCEYGEGCEFSGWFGAHLSSAPFMHGLVCLIREQCQGKISQGDAATMCQKTFGGIEITCCNSLETVLQLGQEVLSDTTAVTQVYVKKGQQGCTFYLKHNDDQAHKVKSEIIMRLTKEINALLNNILGSNLLLVLGHLLSCDSMKDVKTTLEQNGIHDSADTEDSMKGPPEPGSPIPEEWHDALDMNFLNNYESGEYVGFQNTAEEEHCCYAVIVEQLCVPSGQSGQSPYRYKIQIGKDEVIEVSALDLYQFKREKKPFSYSSTRATCMELVQLGESVQRSSSTKASPQSLEEAKKEIDKCLAEIWILSAEERFKAIRRLYLRWHPDKNPDCQQLATEAFKYLKNRIEDLENGRTGKPSSHRTGNPSSQQWNTNFRNFYNQWNQEAHRHQCGRERFYRGHNTRYNFWTHHGNVPQPNRAEAERWLRQAQCDLAAADNDTGGKTTEWTLFKVHQAVEKALVAAEYKRHGNHCKDSSISSLAERVSHYSPQLNTLPNIVSKLKQLGVDPKTTQYPNYHPSPHIPNQMFKYENESEVLDMASKLLCKIEIYIH
ncbi:sacsin-like [Oncorhynchus masou masou]|uniref:sacsin-like n=1 Tax=Oncorhynchus masou masou TaxID=90313 RepID=UPI00318306E2